MSRAAEYRKIAARFRLNAEKATLPKLREVHLETAMRWESLAEQVESADF
jgi:hypothetical protein